MGKDDRFDGQGFDSNLLLSMMRASTLSTLRPYFRSVPLTVATTLYEEGHEQNFLYFPIAGIVSLVYIMRGGSTAEMAIVGSDGVVGYAALLGGLSTTTRATVQVEGHALRIERRRFEKQMEKDPPLRKLMMRYIQSIITQISQTAVCNRHHTTGEQLCRWLLVGLDRGSSTDITMTQELMAEMLGVRRESVSLIAKGLKDEGLIEYVRGRITILDRAGLEKRVCECYWIVRSETERLFPGSNRRIPAMTTRLLVGV